MITKATRYLVEAAKNHWKNIALTIQSQETNTYKLLPYKYIVIAYWESFVDHYILYIAWFVSLKIMIIIKLR